ncbi:DUF6875 domain-containing protein [Saccharothrix sp. NRRL B-16314]|uniref:DUF6875 domain-containing protein n=1 Tax=Saccharothrix sp. NRRL B-16314 TaxID=1463825 RepID=UPI00052470F1|nr:hypothetical protein [Saccharothrix sp. NRRL B-16314]
MIGDNAVSIWTAAEVDDGAVPAHQLPHLREILAWAGEYLVSPHSGLGRKGPVCPYTLASLQRGLFHLASPADGSDVTDVLGAVESLRSWYGKISSGIAPDDQELLTILLVLPRLDHRDPTTLDDLQREAKDNFVADGLMIGQFHPVCDQPGLWNADFKALRAPVPLLAIRRLVVFDLPFLVDSTAHAGSYLRRFAPDIPPRVRDLLAERVVGSGNSPRSA